MRALRFFVRASVGASLFLAARGAAADDAALPPAVHPRVFERLDGHAAMGTLEIVGGSVLFTGGAALTTAGLWPCESGDCSTRGLGAALGAPLAMAGAVLIVGGIRDRSNAATLREALEADPSGATAQALSDRMRDRAATETLVGALVTVVGLGGLVASLFLSKGCTHPCTAATATAIGGSVVAVGGLGVMTFGWADRSASKISLGTPLVPVAPAVSPTSMGLDASFRF